MTSPAAACNFSSTRRSSSATSSNQPPWVPPERDIVGQAQQWIVSAAARWRAGLAARNGAVVLAIDIAPPQGLTLLMGGELRLTAKLHALRLGRCPPSRRALADAPKLELGCDPEAGRHQLRVWKMVVNWTRARLT